MTAIEIIVIIVSASIVLSVFGTWLYKKINHLPTGDCSYCSKGVKKMLKDYRKYTESK